MSDEITLGEVQEWAQVADDLAKMKDLEMKLRKDLESRAKKLTEGDQAIAGTTDGKRTKYFGEGFELNIAHGINLNIHQETMDEIYDGLSDEEQKCFKQKWSIWDKNFNALMKANPDGEFDMFDAITEKPGAPTIKAKFY